MLLSVSLTQITNRYFIALLPPSEIQAPIRQIQQHFAEHYQSRGALRSPPHITLQAPFLWSSTDCVLKDKLQAFANEHRPIAIALDGFGAFSPRVIYVNVSQTPELLKTHAELTAYCAATLGIVDPVAKTRPFAPHITVAFRDLTRENFQAAWLAFQPQQIHDEFTARDLTLLRHDGKQWNSYASFPFSDNAV